MVGDAVGTSYVTMAVVALVECVSPVGSRVGRSVFAGVSVETVGDIPES